jgi:hypothetical protein
MELTFLLLDNDHIYTGPIAHLLLATQNNHYNTDSEKVVLAWVKQRLVACIGESVYELTNAKGSLIHYLLPVYTHPNADWNWTSISESGSAIYAAGYAGGNSAIYKFTLDTTGVMPTLTSGVIAAQLPTGEIINKIEYYLGYLMIGTNKGVRAAEISDTRWRLLVMVQLLLKNLMAYMTLLLAIDMFGLLVQ